MLLYVMECNSEAAMFVMRSYFHFFLYQKTLKLPNGWQGIKTTPKHLEITGPYLVMEFPWSFRSNIICFFLVYELCMQVLFTFVIHNNIYGIYHIEVQKLLLLNEKEFHSYTESLPYWWLGFLTTIFCNFLTLTAVELFSVKNKDNYLVIYSV